MKDSTQIWTKVWEQVNAVKAKAKKVYVNVGENKSQYYVDFVDDGKGLPDKYSSDDLFSAGISTTSGSGIGLFHVKNIATKLDANVSISNNKDKGASLRIWWEK